MWRHASPLAEEKWTKSSLCGFSFYFQLSPPPQLYLHGWMENKRDPLMLKLFEENWVCLLLYSEKRRGGPGGHHHTREDGGSQKFLWKWVRIYKCMVYFLAKPAFAHLFFGFGFVCKLQFVPNHRVEMYKIKIIFFHLFPTSSVNNADLKLLYDTVLWSRPTVRRFGFKNRPTLLYN